MGIARYFRYLHNRYPYCVRAVTPWEKRSGYYCDHLFYDVNNLLYGHISNTPSKEEMYKRLCNNIDRIYRTVTPKTSVFLAIDGPGPRGKLLVQRARRFARQNVDPNANDSNLFNGKRLEGAIDVLQFTPGTELMNEIKEALCHYAGNLTLENARNNKFKVFVSGADDFGEGELKIFQHMKSLIEEYKAERRIAEKKNPGQEIEAEKTDLKSLIKSDFRLLLGDEKDNNKKKCIIVGNDADLIVFSLRQSHFFDIEVLKTDAINFNKEAEFLLLNINLLRKAIIQDVFRNTFTDSQAQNVIDDFTLLSLFNGNDYVPRLKKFSFQYAWNSYCYLKRSYFADQRLWVQNNNGLNGKYVPPSINQDFLAAIFSVSDFIVHTDQELFKIHQIPAKVAQFMIDFIEKHSETKFETKVLPPGHPLPSNLQSVPRNATRVGLYNGSELLGQGYGPHNDAATSSALWKSIPNLKHIYHEQLVKMEKHVAYIAAQPEKPEYFEDSQKVYYVEEPGDRFDPSTEHELEEQLQTYIHALGWIMEYFSGHCLNYSFCYPYSSAPDINQFSTSPKLLEPIQVPQTDDIPLKPIEFLLSVAPFDCVSKFTHPDFLHLSEKLKAQLQNVHWRKDLASILHQIDSNVGEFISANSHFTQLNQFNSTLMFVPRSQLNHLAYRNYVFTPRSDKYLKLPKPASQQVICLAANDITSKCSSAFTNPNNLFMKAIKN